MPDRITVAIFLIASIPTVALVVFYLRKGIAP